MNEWEGERLMRVGVRHLRSFSVVVTVPIGCGGFWGLEGQVAVSLKLFWETWLWFVFFIIHRGGNYSSGWQLLIGVAIIHWGGSYSSGWHFSSRWSGNNLDFIDLSIRYPDLEASWGQSSQLIKPEDAASGFISILGETMASEIHPEFNWPLVSTPWTVKSVTKINFWRGTLMSVHQALYKSWCHGVL